MFSDPFTIDLLVLVAVFVGKTFVDMLLNRFVGLRMTMLFVSLPVRKTISLRPMRTITILDSTTSIWSSLYDWSISLPISMFAPSIVVGIAPTSALGFAQTSYNIAFHVLYAMDMRSI
jgi:hypothetical protein